MTTYRVFLLATMVVVQPLSAQQPQLAPAQVQELRAAMEAGNLPAALGVLSRQCGTLLSESQSTSGSASERAERAHEALLCAQQMAAIGSSVAPAESFIQARDLLSTAVRTYEQNLQERKAEEEFLGIRWGVGLGFSVARDDAVSKAEIVDGLVRVTEERKQRPRAVLEYHKYFWCQGSGVNRTTGCGPFVAVAATEDKVLSGVGVGFMYGRKAAAADNDGFSLGVGFVLDDNVRDLGDGFTANEAAPGGETTVRFSSRARWSFLLFVTRTF